MKKLISSLLLASLLLTAFTACAGEKDSGKKADTTASLNSSSEVETTDPTKDEYGRDIVESSIPADVKFDGEELTILLRDSLDGINYEYEFIAESENGDLINDAVYKRNNETEESLGITFEHIAGFGKPGDFKTAISRSITAQDGAYDITAAYGYYGYSWATEGFYYDLNQLDYLDFDKPWWNSDFVNEATYDDRLYATVGDVSLTSINRSYAMFFNKSAAAEYCKDVDLYQLVRDGKWTVATFSELVKGVYNDLNGNGERDQEDFFGWVTSASSIPVDGIQTGLGLNITERDDTGTPVFVYGSERTATAYERIYDLYYNNTGVLALPYGGNYYEACLQSFINGNAIFLIDIFKATDDLRDMSDDYGVLPLFKFDENQEGYYTTSHDAYSMISILSSCQTPDVAAAALEKLSETSYKYVTPTYFEVALKTKYARSNEDAEMYDLIIAGRKYNFGNIVSISIGNVAQLWRKQLDACSEAIMSQIEKQTKSTTRSLEKFLKQLDKLA